jgi:hypothetical protein
MKAEMVFWTYVLGMMIDGSLKRPEGAMFGEHRVQYPCLIKVLGFHPTVSRVQQSIQKNYPSLEPG